MGLFREGEEGVDEGEGVEKNNFLFTPHNLWDRPLVWADAGYAGLLVDWVRHFIGCG